MSDDEIKRARMKIVSINAQIDQLIVQCRPHASKITPDEMSAIRQHVNSGRPVHTLDEATLRALYEMAKVGYAICLLSTFDMVLDILDQAEGGAK